MEDLSGAGAFMDIRQGSMWLVPNTEILELVKQFG